MAETAHRPKWLCNMLADWGFVVPMFVLTGGWSHHRYTQGTMDWTVCFCRLAISSDRPGKMSSVFVPVGKNTGKRQSKDRKVCVSTWLRHLCLVVFDVFCGSDSSTRSPVPQDSKARAEKKLGIGQYLSYAIRRIMGWTSTMTASLGDP